MTVHISQGLISLIVGVVILIQPKFLAWLIAFWLILSGLIELGILRI